MKPRSQPPKELAVGDVIAGKFRLERVVGRGGMGSVWAARHVQLGMPVALKFIEVEEGGDVADARVRFEREARAAGQLRSPHVVQILDHGVDDDRPYIAMELLEGEDLSERLGREGRLSIAAMAKILTQSAKALRRAHEAGIIHRDLKPGNIFLARFDDDEVVKLLDFGVAKIQRAGSLEGQQGTQTGIVFGSPSYMSPEQARGVRALDHRSDLWSLAVIAFRGLTGAKPFQAATIGEMVIKLCIDPLPVATRFAPDLPPVVDTFFARAFARDPDQRFASAPEMAAAFEALAAACGAAAEVAPPPSLPRPSLRAAAPSTRTPASGARAAPPVPAGATGPGAPPRATPPSGAPPGGPEVAFAPGTLTPPPSPALRVGPASVTPPSWGALPPTFGAIEVPVAVAPSAPPPPPPGRPPLDRRVAVRAALGGVAVGLVVLVLIALTHRGGADLESAAAVVAARPTVAVAPPPTTAPPPPPATTVGTTPPALPAPSASAEPSASASAEPAASAEPEPEPSAAPPLPLRSKAGKKKRPNFGY
jgi:serine/threonine-protein kinase